MSVPSSDQASLSRSDRREQAELRPATASEGGALWRLDGAELARLIRLGQISSREAILSGLERLEAVNPRLNAVVRTLGEEALTAADEADRALRRGDPLGPLHGVPVTVKVNVDQRGCPTDNGVVAYRDLIAAEDNPVVANLRRAGGVIIGRTNAPAYSMRWFTDNALHGPTLNPWAPALTPGGSSGGAASAVAAGIGAIAHGNDIAGSVRYPAYCCGILGLRPSNGRVPSFNPSAQGLSPISSQLMAVQGPLARRVRDVRLAFAAMAVADARDPRSFQAAPPPALSRPIRVALVGADGPGGALGDVHRAVAAAVARAGGALAAAGYAVERVEPPGLAEAASLWPRLAMPDLIALLEPLIAENGDAGIQRAVGLWRRVWPMRDAGDCLTALGERLRLLRRWLDFLARYPLVVMPVSTGLPFATGADVLDETATAAIIAAQAPLMATSILGLPALSVPTGLYRDEGRLDDRSDDRPARAPGAVPTGVQIVAGPFREDLCFDAAEVIEAAWPMPTPIDPLGVP